MLSSNTREWRRFWVSHTDLQLSTESLYTGQLLEPVRYTSFTYQCRMSGTWNIEWWWFLWERRWIYWRAIEWSVSPWWSPTKVRPGPLARSTQIYSGLKWRTKTYTYHNSIFIFLNHLLFILLNYYVIKKTLWCRKMENLGTSSSERRYCWYNYTIIWIRLWCLKYK
jgi:hypothetical protein